jgi:zinc transporter
MTYEDIGAVALRPGLVWGFDFVDGQATAVDDAELLKTDAPARGFRWLHFNLADQRTLRWLTSTRPLGEATDIFLSADSAQHAFIRGETIGLVLHDLELDFHESEPRIGALRIALGPGMMITGRHHPVRSIEMVKRRIQAGSIVTGPGEALDLLLVALTDVFRAVDTDLDAQVQAIEDELLTDRPSPDARAITNLRSLMVRLHRAFGGARAVFRRLEDEGETPAFCREAASRFVLRVSSLDSELLAVQSQLRLLRDELDLQATQQTNQNLYFLSILSALLLPATLVTGIFGMNTGGLLWTTHRYGSLLATGVALGSAGAVYLVLRLTGFIRR